MQPGVLKETSRFSSTVAVTVTWSVSVQPFCRLVTSMSYVPAVSARGLAELAFPPRVPSAVVQANDNCPAGCEPLPFRVRLVTKQFELAFTGIGKGERDVLQHLHLGPCLHSRFGYSEQ